MMQSASIQASETENWLTSEEIRQVVSGNTAYGIFANQNIAFAVYLAPNGTVVGRFSDGVQTFLDRGCWRVADNMLYGKWKRLANGVEFGVRYDRVGNTYFAYQADGQLNRIQFFAKGDPEGLTLDSETQIRGKLDRWRELFSQAQFSFNGYEDLYVNSHELLVYDSYAPSGYEREICGWSQYKALWEKYIPIDFPAWQIVEMEVNCLDVKQTIAWSAISFIGEGIKNEQSYRGGQHGTHIWKQIDGEWRIVHEHLTTMSDLEIQARFKLKG
jgi:ketosteroid isomerase-like protein